MSYSPQPEVRIEAPEGFQIDKENSTFEVIKFKKIETQLPKSWDDLRPKTAWYISSNSQIIQHNEPSLSRCNHNLLPTEETAEAMLVLCQLTMLRHEARNGWVPDYINRNENKYCFHICENKWALANNYHVHEFFSFQTEEIRDEFFKNHIDLLNQVKPLFS
jgi:hypothetical protein